MLIKQTGTRMPSNHLQLEGVNIEYFEGDSFEVIKVRMQEHYELRGAMCILCDK